jgi:hypothetical protein
MFAQAFFNRFRQTEYRIAASAPWAERVMKAKFIYNPPVEPNNVGDAALRETLVMLLYSDRGVGAKCCSRCGLVQTARTWWTWGSKSGTPTESFGPGYASSMVSAKRDLI